MAMTRDEIVEILTYASSHDSREVGDAMIVAWLTAANFAGWTYDEAMTATVAHYAETDKWIRAGNVTQIIQNRRATRPPWWQAD
ncbi:MULTISPECIES: hypothetical protein [Actinomycetes]|uniref:hypothetical protein n=1 Tax=Micromonospora sp. NPDC005367 TaxID=3155590 RepID=UPI0033B94C45